MLAPSRSPAIPVIEALQLIEDAAAVIEKGQGGSKQMKSIMAGLEAIWDAVDHNAGVRAAALDTFEAARALSHAETAPDRVRLRRLLRSALEKLRDRVGTSSLPAEARSLIGQRVRAQAA
jgi:hypothetical protein